MTRSVVIVFLIWTISDYGECCGLKTMSLLNPGDTITITSPNYPDEYENDQDLCWQINATRGSGLGVYINDMLIERSLDTLRILDGTDIYSPEITELSGQVDCGTSYEGPWHSSSLLIHFQTDDSVTERGFRICVYHIYDGNYACADECPDYWNYEEEGDADPFRYIGAVSGGLVFIVIVATFAGVGYKHKCPVTKCGKARVQPHRPSASVSNTPGSGEHQRTSSQSSAEDSQPNYHTLNVATIPIQPNYATAAPVAPPSYESLFSETRRRSDPPTRTMSPPPDYSILHLPTPAHDPVYPPPPYDPVYPPPAN